MPNDAHEMIKDYTTDIASQEGIPLSRIAFVEGEALGCIDTYLMTIISNGHLVSVLAYQADVDNLLAGNSCDMLETKIRSALSRLKNLLEA